jgi:hypothetical protein
MEQQAEGRAVKWGTDAEEVCEVWDVILVCTLCNKGLDTSAVACGGRLFCCDGCAMTHRRAAYGAGWRPGDKVGA